MDKVKLNQAIKLAIATMVMVVGVSVRTQMQADAATWHKGTPKVLRGKYKRGRAARSGAQTWIRIDVNKSAYEFAQPASPVQVVKHVSYKKLGKHTYKLRGTGIRSGYYLGGKTSMTLKKSGHRVVLGTLTFHKY